MPQVMAVDHVLAEKFAEAQEDMHLFTRTNGVDVPPAALFRRRWSAVAGENPPFFQMDMHRMDPAGRWKFVADDPGFCGALLYRSIGTVGIKDEPVHLEL